MNVPPALDVDNTSPNTCSSPVRHAQGCAVPLSRQSDQEAASAGHVLHGHRSFVRLDDALDDRQSQARSALSRRSACVAPAKRDVEDPWQVLPVSYTHLRAHETDSYIV